MKEFEKYIIDERTGLKYELIGDYYFLAGDDVPEEHMPIGIWGQRRLCYLRQCKKTTYTALVIEGKLPDYLADVNEQAEAVGIQYEVALSYSDATVTAAVEALDGYCLTLCEEGNYVAPAMNYLYFQQKDRTKLVLESILDEDGSYLVHCNVGRDRTGFVVLLIQSLCGCTEEEMKACEVQAFCNLYTIELESLEYETISYCTYDRNMFLIANPDKIDDMFDIDWENIDVNSVDTFSASYSYCTDYLGMAQEDVDRLIDKLCVGGEL